MSWKLGSLFDGSGGFPLAGVLSDIEPKWASEVEPYPIAVTRERFPHMKHLGDISKVNGAEIEPVDIITFGSPCQDLSVAGKRAGLKHEANGDDETTRSGLFMEAVRIIKEMREATNGEYPRFALWENVPGAFSSNKGEDFRIVLEELIKIVEPTAVMPAVPPFGWPYADSYSGDGWSLAYRVFDAQYWGVPQRRRRIHLVADFRGQCAREVLFEREGLRGYFTPGRASWESLAAYAEGGLGADHSEGESPSLSYGVTTKGNGDAFIAEERHTSLTSGGGQAGQGYPCAMVPYTLKIRSGCEGGGKGALVQTDKSATLATNNDQYLFQPISELLLDDQGGQQISVRNDGKAPTLRAEMHGNIPCVMAYSFDSLSSNSMKSKNPHSGCRQVEVAKTLDTTDPNPSKNQGGIAIVCKTYDARGNGDGDTVSTITGDHENRITDYSSVICMATQQGGAEIRTDDKAPTVTAAAGMSGNNQPVVCYEDAPIPIHDQATRFSGKRGEKTDGKGNGLGVGEAGDPMNTLTSGDRHAVAYAMQGFGDYKDCGVASGLKARDYKDATDLVTEEQPIALDRAFYNQGQNALYDPQFFEDGTVPTLVARGPGAVAVRYIVRRLTPTECARLQGFPDVWGDIEEKHNLTEEEYRFWLDVRNTHAEINGKVVKDYTKKQMLTWYNKLHTDSAEYKMWGNGIALPPALYCMQGIAEALEREVHEPTYH